MRFVWVYFDDRIQSKKNAQLKFTICCCYGCYSYCCCNNYLLHNCFAAHSWYCSIVRVYRFCLAHFFLSLCSRSVICSIIHAHAHKRTHARTHNTSCLPACKRGLLYAFRLFLFSILLFHRCEQNGRKKIKARNYTLFGAENAWVGQIELEQESSIYRTASCVFNFRCCCCCCLCIVWPSIVKLSLCTRDRHMSLSIRTHTH